MIIFRISSLVVFGLVCLCDRRIRVYPCRRLQELDCWVRYCCECEWFFLDWERW